MQGLHDLLPQILVGVVVIIICAILLWLLKSEFLFFKRMLRFPKFNLLKSFPKRRNNYQLRYSLDSSFSLAPVLNSKKKILSTYDYICY